ncbi:DUF2851 family protein [Aquimarina intermedia]|uniref:Uncharacterized protein DUF2851 n=1 Tax=Aquimarina intermedia TaxID=350814 RepID=A0A5S5BVF7_9FLAO|nr:DUF2851 family protein [Aquimarina intermedia]TYP70969.1 uncharacterized protein DUF2851 [Aquimarina intermedia]
MKEDFLHYIWKYNKIRSNDLKTTDGSSLQILSVGSHNTENSGSDFFNSSLFIDDQKWAGNVEIHIKSSDWYIHGHETDKNYDNVILHVVWEDDVAIYRKDNSKIPALELKELVDPEVFAAYENLVLSKEKSTWLTCAKLLSQVPEFNIIRWKKQVYIERLLQKSEVIFALTKNTHNDWEAVLYKMIAKGFGLNANGEAFAAMVNSFPYNLIKKYSKRPMQLEALFFGQLKLLTVEIEDPYYQELQREYAFLKHKHKLSQEGLLSAEFFRLRPQNFPTIRLSQLAALLSKHNQLFTIVTTCDSLGQFYDAFSVKTSSYWERHYTFGKVSKRNVKQTSKSFIDLLVMNVVVPFLFAYNRSRGVEDHSKLLSIMESLQPEKNTVIREFEKSGMSMENAMDSQAYLQLKSQYCVKKKCLQCAFGNYFLNQYSV